MTIWTALAAVAFLAQPTPKFDIASVRPSTTCQGGGRSPGREAASPGRLDMQCHTVVELIQMAYGRDAAVSGGPAWIDSEHYDIVAKAETPQSQPTMRGSMLQALLAERFQLKIHRESKEVPVYALTVGKGGPKLQVAQAGKCTPRGEPRQPGLLPCGLFAPTPGKDGAYAYGVTLASFCTSISGLLDRQVVDKTEIEGTFDIFIEAPVEPRPAGAPDDRSLTGPLGSALLAGIQKVGLKLESAKGAKEFLVVDHVERPSAN